MPILLFILIFVLAIILIIFSLFRKVLSFIFGGFRGKANQQYSERNGGYTNKSNNSSTDDGTGSSKVFSSSEGEYVSYEEVE